ncbi:tRNA (adenosine(37)-N6)-threonylcarbamoyltransferase complex dimerization subunit type 1 TsaB [Alteromonas sp. ASW11-130]|uniref:tRNA (adenosine(37)-N6)-threonylcarbamoyltransferase complex dimerization subunit type 1 TsaB n=1 Tax=Alteromonas sp. ASW11-130 TaxID=3015775 RepID=UPI0022422F01|nr:tRNA (adenosine(37)-N6)-threonylcarbamoyltransferase complex dimerization subunit type 1 TsaB [Alteromonas sp. ASW11-130]MCW8092542.1 tRNA (adenosine(37)-N6)-threonylcarbamoyltransferase complex dimerization subunit type 1 TsaB [Alteromonas sp. ASW11-130]
MNILAIDTATEACSVALLKDNKVQAKFELCPQQHSQRLLPMVDEILAQAAIKLDKLDALAFGRGPGSFTGVRIATGMVQGLAFGATLPVVGVSTLAAMAQQCFTQTDATTCACAIDARMSEVYFAVYQQREEGLVELIKEQVCSPATAAAHLEGLTYTAVGTGWNAYPELQQKRVTGIAVDILYPAAEFMLPLAIKAISNQEAVTAEKVSPVYLRDKVTWKKLPGRE